MGHILFSDQDILFLEHYFGKINMKTKQLKKVEIFFDTNEEKKSSRKIWKKLIGNLPDTR